MIGLWIFLIVLVICITVVICVFLYNAEANFSLCTIKHTIKEICNRLERIEDILAKLKEVE